MTVEGDKLRRVLEALAPRAQDFLTRAVALPSTHGNEAAVQTLVSQTCREAGLDAEMHPIPDGLRNDPDYTTPSHDRSFEGRENVVVRVGGKGAGRSLIINTHTDVVPADDWPDAFDPRVEDGALFGRGACDDKGGAATMLLAALAMKELGIEPSGEVIYQFVIDEEVGGNGSLALIREGIQADGVVVIEPTDLLMHPANRGAIWFRFEFEGKSCHMGRKHEGISAIELACETIGILYEYEKELIRDQESQPLFASYDYPAQVCVGTLHGGRFPSAVPGRATMEGGIGFLPNRPMARVKEDVVRWIEERGSENLKGRYELTFPMLHNDSFETPMDDPLVRTFHAATLDTDARDEIIGWNVSCDARLFAKVGDMPTVVFGPGRIKDAHSDREKLDLADMVTAAETLVRFIEKWCCED